MEGEDTGINLLHHGHVAAIDTLKIMCCSRRLQQEACYSRGVSQMIHVAIEASCSRM
jgi:hypothetical protein